MKFIATAAAPLVAALLLVACGGSSSPGGGGGAAPVSFQAFCHDLKANQTIYPALFDLESALPGSPSAAIIVTVRITAADMATAANAAATLAAEAPRTVSFPGTAVPDLALGTDINGVAQTLKTAATKMANGDTSGYSEVGPGAIDAAGDTNGLVATLSTVQTECTTFGGQ